jgi:hypothetical protein
MKNKNLILYWSITAFAIITIFTKAYFIYNYLLKNSLPVYDGVMYEKNQILRYFLFKQNFSFIERYNQIIYEFSGNHVSSIFNILCIIFNPNLLINDTDIIIRGIISILILFYSIHLYVNKQVKSSSLIILSISAFPIFFHYRFGIFTYIPDLISGIMLLSSYLYTLIFLRVNKIRFLIYSIILICLAIGFRFNFFVYTSIIFFPILIKIIIKIVEFKMIKSNKFKLTIIIISIILIGLYIKYHFNAFIDYYGRDAKYAEISLFTSFKSLNEYILNEVNLLFLVTLVTINIILNSYFYDSKIVINNKLLIYPFTSFFLFLTFFLNATNQPHVFSALFIFLIPIAFVKNNIFNFGKKVNNLFFITMLITVNILINSICFFYKFQNIQQNEIDNSGILLAKKIDQLTNYKKNKKYFMIFESALEIPMDVFFFKKYKEFSENKLKYYYTDFDFYSIDKTLNINNIKDYYISNLKITKPELLIINKKPIDLDKTKKIGSKLNIILNQYIISDTNYNYLSSMNYKNKKILFYKRKIEK